MEAMTERASSTTSHRKNNSFGGGSKRKLCFGGSREHGESDNKEEEEASQLETQPHTITALLPRHLSKKQRRAVKRGLVMWDGNFQAIPRIIDDNYDSSTLPCTKLEDLNLSSNALNLSPCLILRVWDLRLTKRMDKLGSTTCSGGGGVSREDDEIPVAESSTEGTKYQYVSRCIIMPHEFYEDDGPLNIAYQRVFSIEVSQINDDGNGEFDDGGNSTGLQGDNQASPSIANLTMAAFHDGGTRLKRVMARKRRHANRRIRIFFYNKYADAVSNALRNLWEDQHHQQQQQSLGRNMISLENVPAKCILPWLIATPSNGSSQLHVQHYAMNPMGDEEFGVVSPFCICIGDESNLSLGNPRQRLSFDDDELKIFLLSDQPPITQCPLVDDVVGAGTSNFDFEESVATVTSNSVKGGRYIKGGMPRHLSKNFGQCRSWRDLSIVSNADGDAQKGTGNNTENA